MPQPFVSASDPLDAVPAVVGAEAYPPPAARARTLAARNEATVCVAGAGYTRPLTHAVTRAGRVYAVVAAGGPVAGLAAAHPSGELPGMVVVTDLCPVGVNDRVRGTVWLTGWLAPVPAEATYDALLDVAADRPVGCLLGVGSTATLLELRLHDVILSDSAGTVDVPAAEFALAVPDLLHRDEAAALHHLDDAHRDVLDELTRRLPGMVPGRTTVRPVGLDSHGLSLRLTDGERSRDVRVSFGRPLRRVEDLGPALHRLRGSARTST